MHELSIGIIAYKTINLEWLKSIYRNIDAQIIVSFDEPENDKFKRFCHNYIVNESKLGFGKNRKVSMLLASELGQNCIVTDGDGQFPLKSIIELRNTLLRESYDVVIPQRINKTLLVNINGKIFDRGQFELLETLCALKIIGNKDLTYKFDAQPGMYGFKSSKVQNIIPDDEGWLADFEITINTILNTNYILLPLSINVQAQNITNFSLEIQIDKFKTILKKFKVDICSVFEEYIDLFKTPEKEMIKSNLNKLKEGS